MIGCDSIWKGGYKKGNNLGTTYEDSIHIAVYIRSKKTV